MSRYISGNIRNLVIERANNRCEYCRIDAKFSFIGFQIDHIISIKHHGNNSPNNLAYACPVCNINKGSDIATILDASHKLIRFFNPRLDNWDEHFLVEPSGFIQVKSEIAEATIKILNFNHPDSIIERKELIRLNRW